MNSEAVQEKNASYAVPALEKGLRILEDLSRAGRALSLAELAELQGRGRNELYRMLNCLEREGYVWRDPETKLYWLSLKLFRLSHNQPPLERLREVADRELRVVAAELGESCHACALDGSVMTVIAQRSGGERIRLYFDYGAEFDPAETCSGKLLLSRYRGDALERRLSGGVGAKRSAKARRALEKELAGLSGADFLREPSGLRPGVEDFAVVFGRPGVALATLAVAHLPGRAAARAPERIEAALRAAAHRAETELGLGEDGEPKRNGSKKRAHGFA